MGLTISQFVQRLFSNKNAGILMVGLDAAGKTTILYKLKLGEVITCVPTLGFNVETVEYKNIKFTVWDVGGQKTIRKLWQHYYQGIQGIIFVVDSNDVERISEAREELDHLMSQPQLNGVPIVILANKQDLPNRMPVNEIVNQLGLASVSDRKWYIQATVATEATGLYEGLDWLSSVLP